MKARKYDEIFAPNVVLDQRFVPAQDRSVVVAGTIIDSAAMMNAIQGPQGSGQRVQLLGVTGDQVSAEIADVVFPILTQTKKPYTLTTKGTTRVRKVKGLYLISGCFVQSWFQSYIRGWNTARSHFWWGIDDTYRSASYSCFR